MTDIPNDIHDTEPLYRRIPPTFVRPDGSVSSQAFRDAEMSADRGRYCTVDSTLHGYSGYGISAFLAEFARSQFQEVVADPELLNPAHALVKGKRARQSRGHSPVPQAGS